MVGDYKQSTNTCPAILVHVHDECAVPQCIICLSRPLATLVTFAVAADQSDFKCKSNFETCPCSLLMATQRMVLTNNAGLVPSSLQDQGQGDNGCSRDCASRSYHQSGTLCCLPCQLDSPRLIMSAVQLSLLPPSGTCIQCSNSMTPSLSRPPAGSGCMSGHLTSEAHLW